MKSESCSTYFELETFIEKSPNKLHDINLVDAKRSALDVHTKFDIEIIFLSIKKIIDLYAVNLPEVSVETEMPVYGVFPTGEASAQVGTLIDSKKRFLLYHSGMYYNLRLTALIYSSIIKTLKLDLTSQRLDVDSVLSNINENLAQRISDDMVYYCIECDASEIYDDYEIYIDKYEFELNFELSQGFIISHELGHLYMYDHIEEFDGITGVDELSKKDKAHLDEYDADFIGLSFLANNYFQHGNAKALSGAHLYLLSCLIKKKVDYLILNNTLDGFLGKDTSTHPSEYKRLDDIKERFLPELSNLNVDCVPVYIYFQNLEVIADVIVELVVKYRK